MRPRVTGAVVLLLAPLLLASTDPQGDLVSCTGTTSADAAAPIDIVKATGRTIEGNTALRFRFVFAEPLPVPDTEGRPLRVDLLLRDPAAPDVSVDYYRRVNRIVRFDAVDEPGLTILLLPERAQNVVATVTAEGDALTMSFPGRVITRDPDVGGFDFSGFRWTVVARDEVTCDFLGEDGRPRSRIRIAEAASSPTPPPPPPVGSDGASGGAAFLVACLVSMALGGGVGLAAARWRRRAG